MEARSKQTTDFDDYRRVDGIVQAFKTKVANQQITITTTLKRVQHNIPIEPALFQYEVGTVRAATGAMGAAKPNALAQPGAAVPFFRPDEAIPEKTRLETFELVWSTVNDTYWDANFGGLNWQAVHENYLARAKATARSDEFHELLNEMLAELDRSHFKVQPPDKTLGLHTRTSELTNGSVGLDLRWVQGELLVFDVKKGFPADRAGLKRGSRISRINGKDPDQLLAAYKATRKGFALRDEIQRVRAAIEELTGAPETDVTLEVSDADELAKQVKLTRLARPTDPMAFESRKIAEDIGYIRFSVFMGDVLTQTMQALSELRETTGLVIDLRGNPGGIGPLTTSLATLLCSGPGTLGSSTARYGKQEHSYVGGGKKSYRGRIAILVDEMTGSAAEVFSGGLQDTKRATIIGSTTAGAVLPSIVKILPTGGSFQHVIADFEAPSGVALEGRGVIPDIAVKATRQAWLSGTDPVLDRAIRFLRDPT